jgi:hypothetical protein
MGSTGEESHFDSWEGQRTIFLFNFLTGSGSQPGSYTVGAGGYFLKVKPLWRESDNSLVSGAEIEYMYVRSIHFFSSISDSTAFCRSLASFFSFVIQHTFDRTPWTVDQPVARPLPTHRTTQTQNKCTQVSMPWMGFEPRSQCSSERRQYIP